MYRMTEGKETWHRLLEWDRGQAPAERLAALLLNEDGFENIEPSYPLGGKDGLKDFTLNYKGIKWIGAVFFPRGQVGFKEIKEKFKHDLSGIKTNTAYGFAFFTNQELRLAERKELTELDNTIDIKIYHLEIIASMLNRPANYGIRLEFLDIEMSKEEQLSFHEVQTKKTIEDTINRLFSERLDDFKFALQENEEARSLDEILEAIEEFTDKIWFDRHMGLKDRIESKKEKVNPEIWKGALKSAQKMIKKYGEDNLGPYSSFDWGMLNGKLSALRWVLGDDWDMLDT